MSTREDREWDERQEYGWGNPLDGGMARMSHILADSFGPDCPHEDWVHEGEWHVCVDCGMSVMPRHPEDDDPDAEETPVFDSVVDDAGWNPLEGVDYPYAL